MPKIVRQTMKPKAAPVKSYDAWDLIEWVRLLLYGSSGSGKTTFAATFPGPILWLLCSGGRNPGELRSVDTPEYRKKIKPYVINSSAELEDRVEEAKSGFATTVLDHVSGFVDLLLKEAMGWEEIPAQKPIIGGNKAIWGEVSDKGKGWLRALLNLPTNVVIIAQERTFDGGEADVEGIIKPTVGAAVNPALAGWLNPACDYVMQMYKRPRMVETSVTVNGKTVKSMVRGKGVEYCARTEAHDVFMTKVRVPGKPALPECIVDPDYDKFMALIRGDR